MTMPSLDLLIEGLRQFLAVERPRQTKLDKLMEKSFRVGTVRKWGGVDFQKQGDLTWAKVPSSRKVHAGSPKVAPVLKKVGRPEPVTKKRAPAEPAKKASQPQKPPPAKEPPATPAVSHAGVAGAVPGFVDAVKAGKLASGVSAEEHVKLASAFLDKHKSSLTKSLATLESRMPEGVHVKGRVKELESALGKLVRKPKYGTVEKLQDGTGMRVIAPDTATLDKSIEALKKNYKVIDSDDYVSAPLGGDTGLGYRSFHAIIEDSDGLQKEIQLRTPNQNTHADWAHDIYKPVTPEQDAALKQHADTISAYARQMGDFFHEVDSGKKPSKTPPCPDPVKTYFTCL